MHENIHVQNRGRPRTRAFAITRYWIDRKLNVIINPRIELCSCCDENQVVGALNHEDIHLVLLTLGLVLETKMFDNIATFERTDELSQMLWSGNFE